MTAEEWFDKRDILAHAMGVEPKDVPAGAVWYLNLDQSFSEAEIHRALQVARAIA
jgi:hypothetical protein